MGAENEQLAGREVPAIPEEPRAVYESVLEALYLRALRPLMPEACRRELAAAGLDLSAPLKPQYSPEDTNRFIRIARTHLFPGQEDEEAYLRLGQLFVQGYFRTPLGGAVRMLLRLLGPERNLLRMPAYFEGGTSYIKVGVKKLAPADFELTMSEVTSHPAFTQGALLQAVKSAGALHPRVEYRALPGGRFVYRVHWTQA